MTKLKDVPDGAAGNEILGGCLAMAGYIKCFAAETVELAYPCPAKKPNIVVLYWGRERILKIGAVGPPWNFDDGGRLFPLVIKGATAVPGTQL